jgi:hypothetical protein
MNCDGGIGAVVFKQSRESPIILNEENRKRDNHTKPVIPKTSATVRFNPLSQNIKGRKGPNKEYLTDTIFNYGVLTSLS